MATDIQLDEALLAEAKRLGKHVSARAAIEDALREYVQRRKQAEIVKLFGKIDYAENYDYKAARRCRNQYVPNKLTAEVLSKSEKNQDIERLDSAEDLFSSWNHAKRSKSKK